MHRAILALTALSCLALPGLSFAQRDTHSPTYSRTSPGRRATATERPGIRPASPIPFQIRPLRILADEQDELGPADSLSESQILMRLSRIYGYQARILAAQANDDNELAEQLLALAMTELSTLLQQPASADRPRFQELYRAVITEYERFYGVSSDTVQTQYGDIFQFRADMFAALNEVDEPLLEDVMLPRVEPVRGTIPMTMNRLVESSIRYLLRSPDRHLYHWLSRAETYFPMVEQILREEGVPDEMKYLAMIESGLNPRAKSWAQANGMWQFIAPTGKAYGLQVNSWVDERLDPEKATRAAARHLRDLYEMFGQDWHLAMAGYNCSPARIKRAIARAEARLGRKATFWDIYDDIPKETRNYVPMFIAAALVASNPQAFDVDMDRVRPGPRYAYHYVPVHGRMPLDQVAQLAGTDEAMIRALNPELKRASTPPSQKPYYVRIPLGSYEQFAAAYADAPKTVQQADVVEYTVRRGDTVGKIATRHGITVSELMRSNDLRSTSLRAGQKLTVPVQNVDSQPLAMVMVDMQDAEAFTIEYGERAYRPIAASDTPRTTTRRTSTPSVSASRTPVVRTSAPAEQDEAPAESEPEEERAPAPRRESRESETRIVYRVRRGDNLTEIARKYGVSVGDIKSWNRLRSTELAVGQRLHLYETSEREAPAVAASTTPRASENPVRKVTYRVRRGDTLAEIAQKHGVSIADLREWNRLRSNTIRSGQRLTIHSGQQATSEPRAETRTSERRQQKARPEVLNYRVRRGDTLTDIARKHGVSVEDLKQWNRLRGNTIRTGQRLKIRS